MKDINANDRGRAAFFRNKTKQPLNDVRFVELMYAVVEESDLTPREAKAAYISEWKSGWDEAKSETEAPTKPTKKKAKKKVDGKKKIIRKRAKK